MEKKEIERAENNAHLAYHYYKLSKYMDNDNLEKYQHLISNGQEDNGRIQKKSNVKKSNLNRKHTEILISFVNERRINSDGSL